VTELLAAGATAFGLVNTALTLMTAIFEPSALLLLVVGACETLFGIGATALTGAFTSDQYDLMLCIFYCLVDDDGQVSESAFAVVMEQMTDQLNTTAALVTNLILSMQGEVGLSNAGVIGGESGDCSGCDACGWVVEYDFSTGTHGFNVLVTTSGTRGAYVGDHFEAAPSGGIQLFLTKNEAGRQITGLSAFIEANHGTGIGNARRIFDLTSLTPITISTKQTFGVTSITPAGWQNEFNAVFTSSLGWGFDFACDSNNTGFIKLYKIRVSGTGTPPTDGIRVNSL
jgi:hypothetical protein